MGPGNEWGDDVRGQRAEQFLHVVKKTLTLGYKCVSKQVNR